MDVTVLTSVANLSEIKSDWDTILEENSEHNFYYSFDWIFAACHFFIHPVSRPFIVCIREGKKPIAIIPCCINRRRLRLFSFNSLELIGNIYSAYRGGIVLKGREADAAQALANLLTHRQQWDMIHFDDLPASNPFLVAFHQACHSQRNMITRITDQYANLVYDILPGMRASAYWQSRAKNHRQNIRSAINKLNREGRFTIVLISRPDQNIQTAMDHYYDIFNHSWRKEPEISPQFHRHLAAYLASNGKLRLFVLYYKKGAYTDDIDQILSSYESKIDSQQTIPDSYVPIATSFFAVNGFYAGLLKTAYREDYAAYSAGTVLSWFSVKWLLDVDHVNLIDFQKEDDDYKYKWGRLNDMHILFQAANPRCPLAMLEIWGEKNLIPVLRKIKKTRLGSVINNFLGQCDGRTLNETVKPPGHQDGDSDR
jgi:CelD/BcsL family acetyltransferase involved in cellulose biosynthesis